MANCSQQAVCLMGLGFDSPVGFFGNRLDFAGYLLVTELWMLCPSVVQWQTGAHLLVQPVPASLPTDPCSGGCLHLASAMVLDTSGPCAAACRFGQQWDCPITLQSFELRPLAEPLQEEVKLSQCHSCLMPPTSSQPLSFHKHNCTTAV